MSWDIAVAGTAHLNDITTPLGHHADVIGGSAVYFSLAASQFTKVHFNGIAGNDRAGMIRDLLMQHGVDTAGLQVSERPTLRWTVIHDFEEWIAREVSVEEGCDPEWRPVFSAASSAAPICFIGSLRPEIQRKVLQQTKAKFIGVDSMTSFIRAKHDQVMDVVEAAHILFLNHDEVKALVPEAKSWKDAAQQVIGRGRLRAAVIKAGPYGAALVTREGILEKDPHPVDPVMDPTGAGDCLAGGFIGYCAAAERDDFDIFPQALDAGLRCAAAAISTFGTEGISRLSSAAVKSAG